MIGSTQDLERVELFADLPRPEVGGDRGTGDAGHDDGGHERGELTDRCEDEEATESVEGAEEGEEVRCLESRGAEAERHGRDQEREPAELEGKEELADELVAVRIRGPYRRADRPTGEQDQFSDLGEEIASRGERPVCCCSDHLLAPGIRLPKAPPWAEV